MTTLPLQNPAMTLLAARAIRVVVRNSGLAFAQIAPDLTITLASPNLQRLTSDPTRPVEGRALSDAFPVFIGSEQALKAVLNGVERDFRLGYVNHERADGSVAYLKFQVVPLDKAEPAIGLLMIVEDITPTAQLEQRVLQDRNALRLLRTELDHANTELQRLIRRKSFLISMAAHDLRSPLTAIKSYADALWDSLPEDAGLAGQRKAMANIRVQVDRLDQLIADMLDLDQLEQGKLSLQLASCDLIALIRGVAEMFNAWVTRHQQTLTLDLPEGSILLQADPTRLSRIFHHLIDHAVKHTPDRGHIRVTARVAGKVASAAVSDTGPGLTEAERANLFQLYQAGGARQGEAPGVGLGLFIVKTLVEAHAGRVEVRSQPGQGSTFTVHLPLNVTHTGAG